MPIEYASCDEQYKKFPQLDKAEVLKLQEWYEMQPHLPHITGDLNTKWTKCSDSVGRGEQNTFVILRCHCIRCDSFHFTFICKTNVLLYCDFLSNVTCGCVFCIELEAIVFLHACNYSMEKAKICLDTYHTTRTHCPEFFGNRDVFGEDITSQMKILWVSLRLTSTDSFIFIFMYSNWFDFRLFAPLPNLTPDGYRVVLCKLTDLEASKWNYADSIKL